MSKGVQVRLPAYVRDYDAFVDWVATQPQELRGGIWERFTERYLQASPAPAFRAIWRAEDPALPDALIERLGIERVDIGQDFVAVTEDDRLYVIQAKWRGTRETLNWRDLTHALAVGADADGVLFVSNVRRVSGNAPRGLVQRHATFALKRTLQELPVSFFETWAKDTLPDVGKDRGKPYPRQETAVRDLLDTFQEESRVQLIAACGTGKTRMGLWTMEGLSAKRVLFLAPSLALISQAIREWTWQASTPLDALSVCGDQDVADEAAYDAAIPVTRDIRKVREHWTAPVRPGTRRILFATYQSADQLASALAGLEPADIMVCDEAHRIAGDASKAWQIVLEDSALPARRRLFMTATPRFVDGPKPGEDGVACMSDPSLFGVVGHKISFREAIDLGLIADYRMYVIGVDSQRPEVQRAIERRQLIEPETRKDLLDAHTVAQALALQQAAQRNLFNYCFAFHNRLAHARGLQRAIRLAWGDRLLADTGLGVVDGTQPLPRRRAIIENGLAQRYAVIGAAKALSEGVDVPVVDAAVFSDPKESVIDIVQAMSRALRKDPNNPDKIAKIIIPIPVLQGVDPGDKVHKSAWRTAWRVVTAMAQHDEMLAENLNVYRAELGALQPSRRAREARAYIEERIVVDLPGDVSYDALREAVHIALVDHGNTDFWAMLPVYRAWEAENRFVEVQRKTLGLGGQKLGRWVFRLRGRYKRGVLPPAHVTALEALEGWDWERGEATWRGALDRCQEFLKAHGYLPHPDFAGPGMSVAVWLQNQVSDPDSVPERLAPGLESLLEQAQEWRLGAGLNALERNVQALTQLDDGAAQQLDRFRDELCREHSAGNLDEGTIRRVESLPGWSWERIERRFRVGADALVRLAANEGGVGGLDLPDPERPRRLEILASWVNRWRLEYQEGSLPTHFESRLDEVPGFDWEYGRERFERTCDLLSESLEGHYGGVLPLDFRAPSGEWLGLWVREQREAIQEGVLASDLQARLEKIDGWLTEPDPEFLDSFQTLARTLSDDGPDVGSAERDRLNRWADRLRDSYHDGGIDDPEKLRALNALDGWDWDALPSDEEEALQAIDRRYRTTGSVGGPTDEDDATRWLAKQVRASFAGTLGNRTLKRLETRPWWENALRSCIVAPPTDKPYLDAIIAYADAEGQLPPIDFVNDEGLDDGLWARKVAHRIEGRSSGKRGGCSPSTARDLILRSLPGWDDVRPIEGIEVEDELGLHKCSAWLRGERRPLAWGEPLNSATAAFRWVRECARKAREGELHKALVERLTCMPGWDELVSSAPVWDDVTAECVALLSQHVLAGGVPRDTGLRTARGTSVDDWLTDTRRKYLREFVRIEPYREHLEEIPGFLDGITWEDGLTSRELALFQTAHDLFRTHGTLVPSGTGRDPMKAIARVAREPVRDHIALALEALPGWDEYAEYANEDDSYNRPPVVSAPTGGESVEARLDAISPDLPEEATEQPASVPFDTTPSEEPDPRPERKEPRTWADDARDYTYQHGCLPDWGEALPGDPPWLAWLFARAREAAKGRLNERHDELRELTGWDDLVSTAPFYNDEHARMLYETRAYVRRHGEIPGSDVTTSKGLAIGEWLNRMRFLHVRGDSFPANVELLGEVVRLPGFLDSITAESGFTKGQREMLDAARQRIAERGSIARPDGIRNEPLDTWLTQVRGQARRGQIYSPLLTVLASLGWTPDGTIEVGRAVSQNTPADSTRQESGDFDVEEALRTLAGVSDVELARALRGLNDEEVKGLPALLRARRRWREASVA